MKTEIRADAASANEDGTKGVVALAGGSVAARLTPEQIKNWRGILAGMLGPVADIMPDSDIQMFRDRMQATIGKPQNPEVSHMAATPNHEK